jgi:hypothetical protein
LCGTNPAYVVVPTKHPLDKDNLDNAICMHLSKYPDVTHDWDHEFSLKERMWEKRSAWLPP